MPVTLRPYQRDALDAVADHVRRGARRMIVSIPTGGGKTVCFAALPKRLGLRPTDKILVLAHRDELVQQAVEKWLESNPGEMVGVEKANRRATPMDRVCVASVQTLGGARLAHFRERFGTPALIVTDEAHHAIAPGYKEIYDYFEVTATGSILHVGVTATPKRSDKVGLDTIFDAIAYSIGIGELIDLGMLVPLVGYRVQTRTSLDTIKSTAGDLNVGQLAHVVDTAERNALVVSSYHDIAPGRKAIVFAANVAHSKHLAEVFRLAGYRAKHVDGETALEDRRKAIADFRAGKLQVLTNCGVFCEGFDEPSIEVVIVARPTESAVLFTQMAGRGTRLHPGKTKAAVIDICDVTTKHSIMTLPSLLGLPANFNLAGRSAVAAAASRAAMVSDNPLLDHMVQDAATLARLTALPKNERMSYLVRHLMSEAKRKNEYLPVDLFAPPPVPTFVDQYTFMSWQTVSTNVYRLRLQSEHITVSGDLLGKFSVVVAGRKRAPETLGVHNDIRYAFAQAELWVRDFRGDERAFVDRSAKWRTEPATPKQIAALKRFRVDADASLTRAQANEALATIMGGLTDAKAKAS